MHIRENYRYSIVGQTSTTICMSEWWRKFQLLMWKNWVLQYRKPLQTVIEILAPVLFSILLVVVRSLVEPELHKTEMYQPFCPMEAFLPCDIKLAPKQRRFNLSSVMDAGNFSKIILYTSPDPKAEELMGLLENMGVTALSFNTSSDLELYYQSNNDILVALEFGMLQKNKDIDMKIRFPSELRTPSGILGGPTDWKTNLLYPIYQMRGPRFPDMNFDGFPSYQSEFFLAVMEFITLSLVSYQNNENPYMTYFSFPKIHMHRFPFYQWMEDPLLQALQTFAGIVVMLSFSYTCMNLVRMITTEKEKQLKEAMKMMGLPNSLHWLAWFVKSFGFLTISIFLITVLLKVKWYTSSDFSVFTYGDPSVVFVFFMTYVCSVITFCFAISVFFSKANTAATVSSLVWFMAYVPYFILKRSYDQLTLSEKLFSSLGMNSAMAYGLQIILMFEGNGEGIQWKTLFSSGSPDDTLTLGTIMLMLILDTFLYLGIALYVEAVFPGDYGVPKPWYFLFTKDFWCGSGKYTEVLEDINTAPNMQNFMEKEPTNLHAGIKIRNLRKTFGRNVAVDNLSLNMYENQITVLLGHNGAGKTTTMSMLTGMFPPTSGSAVINGYDVQNNIDGVRSSLGLCPQHNILFDELTVKEHLYFFSKLKGKAESEINEEIIKYVELLELKPKMNAKSKTLSGGMKRKLCVGIALCGNSKVVMLDEPTAGMDPTARRALWELLQTQKEGRTMLLTTHFMDEADLLGDRIAIMAGGKLKCCGSSFFLKKKYGAGYNLVMEKSDRCDPELVKLLLKRHIPNIEIYSSVGSELNFLLPEDCVSVFEDLLKDLERHSQNLGINSYGISLTTLEEVFMKVGADSGEILKRNIETSNPNNKTQNENGNPDHMNVNIDNKDHNNEKNIVMNQYLAMFIKKGLSVLRTWRLLAITIFVPVIILAVTMSLNKTQKRYVLPPLELNLQSYSKQDPIILLESDGKSSSEKYMKNFINIASSFTYQTVSNLSNTMLDMTRFHPQKVRYQYLTGASFEKSLLKTKLIAWFNNDAYHAAPIALAMILNSVYQKMVNTSAKINFVNHPLPFTLKTQITKLLSADSMGMNVAFNLGFSMTFVSAYYILFSVRERVSKSKHLQFVSGVKVFIFWSTSFICDLISFFVTSVATVATLALFQEKGFSTFGDMCRLLLILTLFSYSVLPFMYLASYFFEIPSTAYTRLSLFGIFAGNMAFLIIQLLKLPTLDLEDLSNTLHWIFLAIPHYAFSSGIYNNYNTFAFAWGCQNYVDSCLRYENITNPDKCWDIACKIEYFQGVCCDREKNYFKWQIPGIGSNIFYMVLFGTVMFVILIAYDYKLFTKITEKLFQNSNQLPIPVVDEDPNVADQKLEMKNSKEVDIKRHYTLALKDVTKYYGNFLAVNGLCLGIKDYECFGLLGINGAGKTTTFKMLTGDIKMSYGEAWVKGLSIVTQLKMVQKMIGYCPQFDALLDDLTARETLKMYCLLRGINNNDCNYVSEKLARDFDFFKHLDKQVKELSGGNKRKLSTAIALVGDPPVLYFDEPTTGMDPATKRYLWNALCKVRDSGKCLVLTSHSMEECEALCTKIAIMVNGNFKCLGSTQHLKSKFAEGYTLTIKVRKMENSQGLDHASVEHIKRFVETTFKRVQLREEHQELITYYILNTNMPWSEMFGVLEKAKQELNIEDYSLGQSSLEQVFLTFTRHQQ